jgi:hypothetical protein
MKTENQYSNPGRHGPMIRMLLAGLILAAPALTLRAQTLATALDNPSLVWTTGGSALWSGQTSTTHDGVDAAQSGTIGDTQESWLQTTVTGPGTLSFWWKVSSEADYDWLRFHLDGVLQDQISGEINWLQRVYNIPEGSHVLRWRYVKDPSTPSGQDRSWLDQVTFTAASGAPRVMTQPVSQTVWEGANLVLNAVALGGPPLSCQWYFNGMINALPNATNASLVLSNVLPADAGSYRLLVTNAFGSATSAVATVALAANGAPSQVILFVDSVVSSPFDAALVNLGRTYERYSDWATFSAVVNGANRATTLVIVDAPSSFEDPASLTSFVNGGGRLLLQANVLSGYPSLGAALKVVIEQRLNDPLPVYDWGGSPLFAGLPGPLNTTETGMTEDVQKLHVRPGGYGAAGFASSAGPGEAAVVIGNGGRTIVNGFWLQSSVSRANAVLLAEYEILFLTSPVTATTPQIKAHPRSQRVGLGANATFSVVAWGARPLSYQWFFESNAVAGATNAIFTLTNVQPGSAGNYHVAVSNAFASVPSSPAFLTVVTAPQTTNVLLFADGPYPTPFEAALGNMQWAYHRYTALGDFNQAVLAADPPTTLAVVAWSWNYPFSSSELTGLVEAGGRAILQVWHSSVSPGLMATFKASVASSLPYAMPVYDWGGSTMFADVGNPLPMPDPYGINFDGLKLAAAAGGSAVAGFTSTAAPNEVATVVGNAGRTVVNGFLMEDSGSTPAAIRFAQNQIEFLTPSGPAITVEPLDLCVQPGQTAAFTVSASGSAPLSYRWYFNETNLLAGAASATLTLPNVQPANAGTYSVVLSNAYGTTSSRPATLCLLYRPVIVQQPQSLTVKVGEPISLSVTATGTPPFYYRWRKGNPTLNTLIPMGDAALHVPSAVLTNGGYYDVVISNITMAQVLSSRAYITVVQPPANAVVREGTDATWQASVNGPTNGPAGVMRYAWQFNGSPRTNGTNRLPSLQTNVNQYALSSVQPAHAGSYAYVLTDTQGTNTAFPFTLTVVPAAARGPEAIIAGKTTVEWSVAWWQWATRLPATAHPLFDTAEAGEGQSGPVWFLGGKFCATDNPNCHPENATRQARIPQGKYVFFPILNGECSTVEGNGTTEAELRSCAQAMVDGMTNLACEVDGLALGGLEQGRLRSGLFTYTLASHDNVWKAVGSTNVPDGATTPAVGDGYYVMLDPLPIGLHTIRFHGELPAYSFALDLTYNIEVTPAPPTLSYTRVANQLSFSWTQPGCVLQENTSLTDSAAWRDVPAGDTPPVVIPIGGGVKFFRLWKP